MKKGRHRSEIISPPRKNCLCRTAGGKRNRTAANGLQMCCQAIFPSGEVISIWSGVLILFGKTYGFKGFFSFFHLFFSSSIFLFFQLSFFCLSYLFSVFLLFLAKFSTFFQLFFTFFHFFSFF